MYEVFEHTADLGIRIRAKDLDSLFVDAARGLLSVLTANPEAVQPVQTKEFVIEGQEPDYLLFDWLSELLFTFETENLLLAECDVHIDQGGLRAVCRGEPVDRKRHEMDHEIKAITYHELKVEKVDEGYMAEVIVDI